MKKLTIVLSLVGLLLVSASATTAYYFYTEYQKSQKLLQNPTEAAKAETKALLQKLGKIIELPQEEPTIATIIDRERLKDQPFFARAENGDKVVIYTGARKAILYRVSSNKVIEVAPISLGDQQAGDQGQVAGQQNQPPPPPPAAPSPEPTPQASPKASPRT